MMKKLQNIVLATALSGLLVSCGGESSSNTSSVVDELNTTQTVEDILEAAAQEVAEEERIDEVVEDMTVEAVAVEIPEGFGSYESVDIDLTTMSSVLVYTQVYTMMANPEDYIGKTVKMHGNFSYYYESSVDVYYYGIVVQDATACCAQGVEFVLAGEHTFPDDYPDLWQEATVVGTFNTYFPLEAPDVEYYHLEDAEFIW